MFVQTPAPAAERWNWALPTPEPPSPEFEVTATELPRTFALEAGAGVGAVGGWGDGAGRVGRVVRKGEECRVARVAGGIRPRGRLSGAVGLAGVPGEVVRGEVGPAGRSVDRLGGVRPGANGAAERGEGRGGRAGAAVGDGVLQLEVA